MADPKAQKTAAQKAPQLFVGWRHIQLTVNRHLPGSLKQSDRILRGIMRRI